MANETEYFLSQDGLKLYYHYWLPEQAESVVCIVHGLGEHGGRYAHLANYLCKNNSAVFALDLRGHGLSQGKRGHAKSYALLLSDVEELLKTTRAEYTELPLFLMGHSMGGNIVANYMIKMNTNDITGFILSSPWFNLAFEPPKWKLKLGQFITGLFPGMTQPSGLIAQYISKDPQVVQDYVEDKKVHNKISAGLYTHITKAATYALEHAGDVKGSGLIYHGNDDKIIDYKSTKSFANTCKDAEWHELDGVYHEPHNDLEKDEVLKLLKSWIKKRSTDTSKQL